MAPKSDQPQAEDAVLDSNTLFYRALQDLDLNAMEQVWLHYDWVFCIHPGWQALRGWQEIKRSWELIFSHTRTMKISLRDVTLQLYGPIAWLTCIEEISSESEAGAGVSLALATNIYMQVASEWKLVHHHASPLPLLANFPGSETVQ